MSAVTLQLALHNRPDKRSIAPARRSMSRSDGTGPSAPERFVDFALCLVLAVAVIALLLLAL